MQLGLAQNLAEEHCPEAILPLTIKRSRSDVYTAKTLTLPPKTKQKAQSKKLKQAKSSRKNLKDANKMSHRSLIVVSRTSQKAKKNQSVTKTGESKPQKSKRQILCATP